MKCALLPRWFAPLALVIFAAISAGCTGNSSGGGPVDPCKQFTYGCKAMEPYADPAHHFAICLPKGLTRKGPAGFADGRVVFSGFAVPAGTNLQSKTLVIVAGAYPDVQGATPDGQFSADGVTFQRTRLDDGSAGHTTLHITYTAKISGKVLHFDFTHFAVNPGVFDPGNRPAVYDGAAQIKLTEAIMGSFRPAN